MSSAYHRERQPSDSLLSGLEGRFANKAVRFVPTWLQSQHLTLLTTAWSGLMLLCSALVRADPRWLLAVSAIIVLQYLTDALDGKVGVIRGAGLVRWGYYMDHFLDYVFLCVILIGYGLMLPERSQHLMTWSLAIAAGFMVHTSLEYGATGRFTLSYLRLGPAEVRLIFIGINVMLLAVGRASMLAAVPYVLLVVSAILARLVFRTQYRLRQMDAAAPRQSTGATDQPLVGRRPAMVAHGQIQDRVLR
jgi:phosphatidylglycerophosphate synthase